METTFPLWGSYRIDSGRPQASRIRWVRPCSSWKKRVALPKRSVMEIGRPSASPDRARNLATQPLRAARVKVPSGFRVSVEKWPAGAVQPDPVAVQTSWRPMPSKNRMFDEKSETDGVSLISRRSKLAVQECPKMPLYLFPER